MSLARAALAGAAAAGAWAAVEPLDRRVLRNDYSDVAMLGKLVTRSRCVAAWPGSRLHATNGALFGLAFERARRRTGSEPRRLALGLALAENFALFPLAAAVDRLHPARGERGLAPLFTARGLAQATFRHALFGAVLGRLALDSALDVDAPAGVGDRARTARGRPGDAGARRRRHGCGWTRLSGCRLPDARRCSPIRSASARALTAGPLGANLFGVHEEPVHEEAIAAYAAELAPEAARLGVELGEPRFDDDDYAAKLAVVLVARARGGRLVHVRLPIDRTTSRRLQAVGERGLGDRDVGGRRLSMRAVVRGRRARRRRARRPAAIAAPGATTGPICRCWSCWREVRDACDTTLVATGGIGDRRAACSRRSMPARRPSRPAPRSCCVRGGHERAASSGCSRVPG